MSNSSKPPRRSFKLATLSLRTAARYSQSKVSDLWDGDNRSRFNKIGEDWFNTLGQLKGAPMKFGQFASQFADMLPPELAVHLNKLRSDADPLPLAALEPVLQQAWGGKVRAQVDISTDALAAASIGQVHRARFQQHSQVSDVVVKIRYPDIHDHFDKDMRALRRLIRFGRILDIPKADLDEVFTEIKTRVSEEMDFAREREHLQQLKSNNHCSTIYYPAVIDELCRDNVLVTEYLPGETLEQAKRFPQTIRNQIGDTLVSNLLQQIMVSGVVHADPNPGNFAFRANGDVVIYDYGCVKQVPIALREQLRQSLLAFRDQRWQALHHQFIDMGGVAADYINAPPPVDLYTLWHGITMQRFVTEQPFDFANPTLHDDAVAGVRKSMQYRKHFRPVADMVFINRTISGLYWMLRTLGSQVDLVSIMKQAGTLKPHT